MHIKYKLGISWEKYDISFGYMEYERNNKNNGKRSDD